MGVPRFRLRHANTDLVLAEGEFVIGRSSTCHLALDDGLVSRRHAVLEIDGARATVRDLESRNGVSVNGTDIRGKHALAHLDRIGIGNQEMVFIDLEGSGGRNAATVDMRKCDFCGYLNGQRTGPCAGCGRDLETGERALEGATMEISLDDQSAGHAGAALALVGAICDKALALGRVEEAERLLERHLDAVLEALKTGGSTAPGAPERAAEYAEKLAAGKNAKRWLDYLFALGTARATLMPAETVEALHELARSARYNNGGAIRAYLAVLDERGTVTAPADRFRVRRLEALLRVVSA